MSSIEELEYVNSIVAVIVPGDIVIIETKMYIYQITIDRGSYWVAGGMYGLVPHKLQVMPQIDRQGSFTFYDNPVFKHYVTRTSEVVKVSVDEKVIFSNGR